MAVDLHQYVQNVWSVSSVENKRVVLKAMIEASHAKNTTKKLFMQKVDREVSPARLDKLAVDYMMSGEGMKAI